MKAVAIVVVFASLPLVGIAGTKPKVRCKTPETASRCYWTKGRLSFYNGTPSFRLWKIGTHRMLGIYSGPNSEKYDEGDNEHPKMPVDGYTLFQGAEGYGDFEVCPLEPERPHTMQRACIAAVRHLRIVK